MIAEINNKISSSGTNLSDRLEDQLTSDVFGAIRYLPIDIGILPLLNHCHSCDIEKIFEFLSKSKNTVYHFWPKSLVYGEIDLIIEFYNQENTHTEGILGIEVKYNSPISSDQEIPKDVHQRDEEIVIHQLWRYMKLLKQRYPLAPKGLIFLTNDMKLSKYHINKANILDKGHSCVIGLSISWSKVHQAIYKEKIKNHSFPFNLIIADIEILLKHKQLDSYIPLTIPKIPSIGYKFTKKKVTFIYIIPNIEDIEYVFMIKTIKYKYLLKYKKITFFFKKT